MVLIAIIIIWFIKPTGSKKLFDLQVIILLMNTTFNHINKVTTLQDPLIPFLSNYCQVFFFYLTRGLFQQHGFLFPCLFHCYSDVVFVGKHECSLQDMWVDLYSNSSRIISTHPHGTLKWSSQHMINSKLGVSAPHLWNRIKYYFFWNQTYKINQSLSLTTSLNSI